MSKINELIKKLCPNGVEYKKVWEVTTWDKKYNAVEKSMQPRIEKYNYLLANQLNEIVDPDGDVLILETGINSERKYTNIDLAGNNLCDAEIIAIPWGGTPNVKYYKGKFVTGDNRIAISNDINLLNTKFLYYIFENKMSEISDFYRGSGIKHPEMKKILLMNIPIPPIDVQQEIVKILDKFCELETELETELEARKSQYEFWCGKLLDNDYETEALDSLCIKTNNINWKNDFETYKYIDLSSVNRDNNTIEETIDIDSTNAPSRARQIVKCNDILFGTTRPMLKRITIVSKEYDNQICSTGYCVLRPDQNKILPEWMYFNLQTEKFYKYVESFQQGASYPSISDSAVKNYEISIPPLEEQKRIVKILDKFDKLVNDITVGLPAEIELRKQQYEYYRNKLLSFEEYVNE